jgi:hypothetical protein
MALSKNFQSQPTGGGISTAMWTGDGTQSPMMHETDANAPLSKSSYQPAGNPPVSKNFTEAAKVAKSASKIQGGKTHAAFRKGW